MGTYMYGQVIPLDNPPVYAQISGSNSVYAFTLRTEINTTMKARCFRDNDADDPGTMRVYGNDKENNVQVGADSLDWVQIPGTNTDLFIVGDLETGTIEFRTHLEPVAP